MRRFVLVALLNLVLAHPASAISFPEWGKALPVAPVYDFAAAAGYDFDGIVALANCSGSLVRFDDSNPADKALVLTNGHCVGMLRPGEVVLNRANGRSFTVLDRSARKIGTVRAQRILYAAMTGTDAALYELKESFREISSRYGTSFLTLSREAPVPGTNVEVVSGYWRSGYSCSIEATVFRLQEADWSFSSSLRFSRPGCETKGGTSGSPVIAAGTRTVIAVNNTGNESGRRCAMNNPCEIDEQGNVTFEKGYSYAQQTYWFYSCRDQTGALDLSVPGCLLAK